MGEGYYNTKYNINPKFREMMEKRIGKQIDLSHSQVEQIISSLFKDGYRKFISPLTEKDKENLIFNIKLSSPNSFKDKDIDNLILFLNENFTENEILEYLNYCIDKYYKPGMIYLGIRIFNDGVIYLIDKSGKYYSHNGIIINKKYINDLTEFFDKESSEFNYNDKSLLISDDLTNDMIDLYNEILIKYDVDYFTNDEIFIIIAMDEISSEYLKERFKGLKVQKILDFQYYTKK